MSGQFVVFAACSLLLFVGCGNTNGEQEIQDSQIPDGNGTTETTVVDGGDMLDLRPLDQGGDDYTGPSGCVACHTNKEQLVLLAPPEEEEEEGGGG